MPSHSERHARDTRAAGLRGLSPLSPTVRRPRRSRELRTSRRALERSQILTAAAELFRARGFRATTLDELARRLRISKKTLYGHFRSKEDLLAAIFHRTMSLVEDGLATIVGSKAPPIEQLREVIRHQVRTVVAEQAFLTVFFAEEASLPARLRRAIVRRKSRYDHTLQAIVARTGQGALAAHPRLIVFALLGMGNWVHRWYDPRGAWDADAIAEAFIALLERGYLAPASGTRDDVARRLANIEGEVTALRLALGRHEPRRNRRENL